MEPTKPIRVQRSRKHKQVSPNGLPIKYVGRPSKWGNPYRVMGDAVYIDIRHRRSMGWAWVGIGGNDMAAKLFDDLLFIGGNNIDPNVQYWVNHFAALDFSELRGKNLSCWCPVNGCDCHADLLLEVANK